LREVQANTLQTDTLKRVKRLLCAIQVLVFATAASALGGCGGGGGGGGGSAANAPALPAGTPSGTPIATPSGTPIVQTVSGGETPRSADAFVDSAGINVHLSSFLTIYGENFPAIAALLASLGVRHIRDGSAIGQPSVCAEDVQLASAGIHLDLISAVNIGIPAFTGWVACLGPAVDAIEDPNEYDLSGNAGWAAALGAYAQQLYPAMKPATIIAPALTSEAAFLSLGSLSASVDSGNMHDYFAGRNPGTPGWGGTDAYGEYGSLAFNMNLVGFVSGGKPVIATETGYSDAVDQYAVPAATKARYVLRTLLEHWNAGVTRTYFFELVDEGIAPFSHYGFTDAAGNPKPAFVAVKNLLAHLSDPGGAFATVPLTYSLTAPSFVHHTLLQKRSGRYALVLWIEQPEWDPDTSSAISVAPQTVTLSFARAPSALASTVFDDGGNVATSTLAAPGGTATLQVSAGPTIVDVTP
jgi:hypothetical protein